jgi:type III secretion protein Q
VSVTLKTRPFPWASLDSLTTAQASVLRAARRWGAAYLRLDDLESVLGNLLRTGVRVRVRRVENLAGARTFGAGYGVLMAGDDAQAEALLQVETALATTVVARAIDQAPAVFHKVAPESAAIAGAFAAVIGTAARRAHETAVLRAARAGSAAELQADLPISAQDWAVIALTVTVGDDAYSARVVVSPRALPSAPDPAWTRETLLALGATPLSLPVVAAVFEATALDLASLEPGDALLPPQWPLARASSAIGWAGPLLLAAPSGAIGINCVLSDDGRLVLRGDPQALFVREAEMVELDESSALVTAIGDVPVLVRVEIGEARMAARDWAGLQRGDVIALGRRVGERVVLRVGGVPVASGELVEIDGDVGVRIVERLNLGQTSA